MPVTGGICWTTYSTEGRAAARGLCGGLDWCRLGRWQWLSWALFWLSMYAVVQTGGKQYRVMQGQTLEVEKVGSPGRAISLRPVLLADGDRVLARPSELVSVEVKAVVVGERRGPKIRGFTYKSKSNQRRSWGHRQPLSTIEITDIAVETAGVGADGDSVQDSEENEADEADETNNNET